MISGLPFHGTGEKWAPKGKDNLSKVTQQVRGRAKNSIQMWLLLFHAVVAIVCVYPKPFPPLQETEFIPLATCGHVTQAKPNIA